MNTIPTLSLEAFQTACKEQAPSGRESIAFICPMCGVIQSAKTLIKAGVGKTFEEVEKYLGFSCVGRWTGAKSPRSKPDGNPCNWTLGGLFSCHKFQVQTPDGKNHPMFEIATKEQAQALDESLQKSAKLKY